MNYWLISDTHFNHLKLEEWGGRTGRWQEQLYLGLSKIPDGDILIHLGDLCIGGELEVHSQLFSKEIGVLYGVHSILIKGNHDRKSSVWYMEHGWDMVADGLELVYQGHYLHLTHRPARPQGNTTRNIHGHTHGNMHRSEEYLDFYDKSYHLDISPELVGFVPVRLDLLLRNKKTNG